MNALEKLRCKEEFKNYKDDLIIDTFCPDKEKITKDIPSWCKRYNTSKKDCKRCWEREV